MKPLPLRLALEPVLPSRTPTMSDCFEYGFRLRLPRGPALERNDPLLTAFGASVAWLEVEDDHEEALQHEGFDPGRPVRLVAEPFDPEDPDATGVWDAECTRQGGMLPQKVGAVVSAGEEIGLDHRGLVLSEHRSARDDRRERLGLLVYSPALVRVAIPRDAHIDRPARASRRRLVLVADESGDVRWWDPSVTGGPLEAGDLPFSQELRGELERLRDDFAALSVDADDQHGFDRIASDWEREALEEKAAALWRRARSELGRRYAVGFLGSGMKRPLWSPGQRSGDGNADDEMDIPF